MTKMSFLKLCGTSPCTHTQYRALNVYYIRGKALLLSQHFLSIHCCLAQPFPSSSLSPPISPLLSCYHQPNGSDEETATAAAAAGNSLFTHQRSSSTRRWTFFKSGKVKPCRSMLIDFSGFSTAGFHEIEKDAEFCTSKEPENLCNIMPSTEEAATKTKDLGAFQRLPIVSPSSELLGSAIRKAKRIQPTKGIMNIAKRERNRGAKQLDALTKELAVPLRIYVDEFPRKEQLHAYENALIELTFGRGKYEEILGEVNLFRKKILEVGKNYASLCAKSTAKREAEQFVKEGTEKLEELFRKRGNTVDDLLNVAKILRHMPVLDLKIPTLCLVGAPNVGKSSLVRVLSTGKPEVCNYPFTTRGISMGHISLNFEKYQVTDTPGLLNRPDDERNSMEMLTLAALSYLPTAILFVHDLTGDYGTSVCDQFEIYKEIKRKFSDRPWIDVVSKADLLHTCKQHNETFKGEAVYRRSGPFGALHVSVETGQGIQELKEKVHVLLSEIDRIRDNK